MKRTNTQGKSKSHRRINKRALIDRVKQCPDTNKDTFDFIVGVDPPDVEIESLDIQCDEIAV